MGRAYLDHGVLRRASVVLSLVLGVSLVCVPVRWAGVDGQPGPEVDYSTEGGSFREGDAWVHVDSNDGVMTAYLHEPGSRHIGLKGSAIVEHHISNILNVFLNTTQTKEWVSFLGDVAEYPTNRRNQHVVYQYYRMPWPLGDRDFVLERTVEVDKRSKVVSAHYRSVEHPSKPVSKGVVRGETTKSTWKFRSLGALKTEIQVESTLNPKLPVSGRIIGMMQSTYQRSSINQLVDLVSRAHRHPEYAHW